MALYWIIYYDHLIKKRPSAIKVLFLNIFHKYVVNQKLEFHSVKYMSFSTD